MERQTDERTIKEKEKERERERERVSEKERDTERERERERDRREREEREREKEMTDGGRMVGGWMDGRTQEVTKQCLADEVERI